MPPSHVEGAHEIDVLGWLATWVVSVATVAFFNPYGPANAFLPFRQLSASRMTSQSADWIPLLSLESILAAWFPATIGRDALHPPFGDHSRADRSDPCIRRNSSRLSRPFTGKTGPEVLMEVLIPLLLLSWRSGFAE